MKRTNQTTLKQPATLTGIGVHSNAPVQLLLLPAEADSGIVFHRTGLKGQPDRSVRANWSQVSMTELCTVIGDPSKATISTIEHLIAAFSGLGVDNVIVEIDGPEVPIMDGSAAPFVQAIDKGGFEIPGLSNLDEAVSDLKQNAQTWVARGRGNLLRNVPEQWASAVKVMSETVMIKKQADAATLYTNAILDKALKA